MARLLLALLLLLPGGMLVQKRGDSEAGYDEPSPNVKPVPTIHVKVKHAGVTHEIYISSEVCFAAQRWCAGERDSKAFLDMAGVKDRSKVVVVEDHEARARRLIEERRNGHLKKAARAIAAKVRWVLASSRRQLQRPGPARSGASMVGSGLSTTTTARA